MSLRLGECLRNFEGRKVRIGAYSAFLYFGIADEQLMDDMKRIDPGCMKCKVTDIYRSELTNDVIIIYHSSAHGRFWFEEEFKRAVEKGDLFVVKGEAEKKSK